MRQWWVTAAVAFSLFIYSCPGVKAQEAEGYPTDGDNIQYDITRTRYLIETEQLDDAFDLIGQMRRKYPRNSQVKATEATALLHAGNWREAITLFDEGLRLDPYNEDIATRKKTVLLDHAPFAGIEREVTMIGKTAIEQTSRFTGEADIYARGRLGIKAEADRLRTGNLIRANGTATAFKETVNRAEFYFTHDFKNGDQWGSSLYLGEGIVGASGRYSLLDIMGKTELEVRAQEPTWDFLVAIADKGTRDSLRIGRMQRVASRTIARGTFILNRYGLDDDLDLATSHQWQGGLTYGLPDYGAFIRNTLGKEGRISVDYSIDGEYPFSVEKKTNRQGVTYNPIALDSREVHTLTLNVSKDWSNLRIKGYGGYSVDRLGDEGESYGGSLMYRPVDNIEIEFGGGQAIATKKSSGTDDNAVRRIGGAVRWLF